MADHNSLAVLFQDIANAIRKLKGQPSQSEDSTYNRTYVADNFPNTINTYANQYLPFKLPENTITVQKSSGTTTYITNDHLRIYGSDNKLYTLKQWNDMWVANGKTTTGMPTPEGYAFDKFDGEVEVLHFNDINATTFYDPQTNTTARTSYMTCTVYNNYKSTWFSTSQLITAWNGVKDITIYDPNSTLVDIYCTNTKQHFFFKTTRVATHGTNGFGVYSSIPFDRMTGDTLNFEERTYNMWVANEWLRHRYAIPSGLTIAETDNDDEIPNGTVRKVEIFNSSGNTPAVNEDMYFWIYSTSDLEYKNTGILAKYNHAWTSAGTAYNITDTIRNNIYAKEKAAGTNMNNTGVNSSTKRQFAPGIRGAEAVMVDGEWYITTPVPSYTSGSGANLLPVIFDSPAVYYVRSKGYSLPSNECLFRYSEAYSRGIGQIKSYLDNVEGRSTRAVNWTSWLWSSLFYQDNPGVINVNSTYSSNFLRSNAYFYSYYLPIPSHRYKPTESKSIYITIPEEQIHQNIKLNSGSYNDEYDLYDLVSSSKVCYWADDFTNSIGDKLYINDELFGTCLETPGSFCTEDESNWVVITQSGGTYAINDVDMREPWGLLKKRLDYAQPALYFDGTAYIDLGTKGNGATDALEITFKSNADTAQQRFIAPIDSAGTIANCTCSMYRNASKRYGYCWNSGWQGLNTDPPGDISTYKHTWKCDFKNKKHTIDGKQYNFISGTSPSMESGSNLLVCGPSNVTSAIRFVGEVYNVKMWRNDVLIRDLTPCGHNPDEEGDNTPGMYDEVNGVYYTNAADSGSFIFIPAAN